MQITNAMPELLTALMQATKGFRLLVDPEPSKEPFDREKYAATVRSKRERDVIPGLYDPIAFSVARRQLEVAPEHLTDADLEQLTLVDHKMGEEARAARAGYVKAGASDPG